MAACCHGICLHLPHHKVVRWLSNQLKKLFRFCSKCRLYIKHKVDQLHCSCCGCMLRVSSHSERYRKQVKQSVVSKKIIRKRWRDKNPEAVKLYYNEWYEKNKSRKRAKSRLYKLKTKLLKIFFITFYPHLLISNVISRPTQIQTIPAQY